MNSPEKPDLQAARRQQRLAEALRGNLRRRKAQSRARQEAAPESDEAAADGVTDVRSPPEG